MIGDIFWSCVGGVNEILGDPIGATCEILDDASRREGLRKRSDPTYRLAEEKMRIYNQLQEYERSLQWAKNISSQNLTEMYQKLVDEYKEKLKLLS